LWTQIAPNFGIITATVKLFEDSFSLHPGITLQWFSLFRCPARVLSAISPDTLERSGFWQIEDDLSYRLTRDSEEMPTSIREIKKQLEHAEGCQH